VPQILNETHHGKTGHADLFMGQVVKKRVVALGVPVYAEGDLQQFAFVASHDLRASMDPKALALLQRTSTSLTPMDQLTQDLRAYARLDATAPSRFLVDCYGVVQSTLVINALAHHSVQTPEVQVRAVLGIGKWTFSVADQGIGISAQHYPPSFEQTTQQRMPFNL